MSLNRSFKMKVNTECVSECKQEAQRYSYAVGTVAGVVAGAVSLYLFANLNPLYLGDATALASGYIAGHCDLWQLPPSTTQLASGALIGGLAGFARVAMDRFQGIQKEMKQKMFFDSITGVICAPVLPAIKCLLSPPFLPFPLLKEARLQHLFSCSGIGGASMGVLTPVATLAAVASRLANEYYFSGA